MSDLALALTIVSIQIALLATLAGGIVFWYRRRYWHRRLHALPAYAASLAASSAGDHAKSLELARAVQERTRRWRGPAAAAGEALLGDRLARLRQWPEALTHLRSAVVGLRGVRGGQAVLAVALMDAALTYDAVNQPADALPLVEEQLELMARSGEGQRRPEVYHLALRQRVELLRRLGGSTRRSAWARRRSWRPWPPIRAGSRRALCSSR